MSKDQSRMGLITSSLFETAYKKVQFHKWRNEVSLADRMGSIKEIKMILRLFLVIAIYCQGSSSQIKPITQPLPLLAGWEGRLGTCSR